MADSPASVIRGPAGGSTCRCLLHKGARLLRLPRLAVEPRPGLPQVQGDDHALGLVLAQVGIDSFIRDQVCERSSAQSGERLPEPQEVAVRGEERLFLGGPTRGGEGVARVTGETAGEVAAVVHVAGQADLVAPGDLRNAARRQ